MIDDAWLAVVGVCVVAAVLVDLAWITLAVAAGRGPLSDRVARGVWRLVRGRSHAVLQNAGRALLVGLLVMWVAGMWAGWSLIFNADSTAVVDASSQHPGGVLARIAYAAGAMAGAGAGYTAGSSGWELANNVAALSGLALFTLAISYLLLSSDLAKVARQHLALPVLHNLHVGERRAAIELAVARLDEALMIVEHGLGEDHGAVTAPARLAITEYLETAHLPGAGAESPPPPDLGPIRRQGVDVVEEAAFRRSLDAIAPRRGALRSLIEQNGWRWDDVTG